MDFYENWIPSDFNIIGCEYSTDIDIIVPVPNEIIIQYYKNKKFILDTSLIVYELQNLGYDIVSRKLDINLVYIDIKTLNIINVLVGEPKLTQNIIYYTYSLHSQAYSQIISKPTKIDICDFTRLFSKIILDWMDKLLGKSRYKQLRPIKAQNYTNLISRLDFSIEILQEVNFINLFNNNKNIIKSLAMKLCQLSLLQFDTLEYTKKNISLQISRNLSVDYDNVLFILSRGKLGKIDNYDNIQKIFLILINQYKIIIEYNKTKFNMLNYKIDIDTYLEHCNLNCSNNFMINEFIKSPEKPTIQLSEYINNQYKLTKSLNEIFILYTFGIEFLPKQFISYICIENQRSIEWLELLKFYNCGNSINNTITFKDCETNFNLIRGCIGEKLLIDLIDWNILVENNLRPVYKCICGLLVENKGIKNSIGISPDLLLISNNNDIVIPVEIKTIVSNPNIINKKILREIKLATKQLETSIELIYKITQNYTFGLMVFCFIHNNQLSIKYKKLCIK